MTKAIGWGKSVCVGGTWWRRRREEVWLEDAGGRVHSRAERKKIRRTIVRYV